METGDEAEGTPGCLRDGMMEKSAVGEHARENHHPIDWEDHGRGQEPLVKEALHIQMKSKRWQVIFRAQVGTYQLTFSSFIQKPTEKPLKCLVVLAK